MSRRNSSRFFYTQCDVSWSAEVGLQKLVCGRTWQVRKLISPSKKTLHMCDILLLNIVVGLHKYAEGQQVKFFKENPPQVFYEELVRKYDRVFLGVHDIIQHSLYSLCNLLNAKYIVCYVQFCNSSSRRLVQNCCTFNVKDIAEQLKKTTSFIYETVVPVQTGGNAKQKKKDTPQKFIQMDR